MAGGKVTAPATRNDPPDPDDWGLVVRPILSGPIPPIFVTFAQPSVAVRTNVAVGAVSLIILAANPGRLGGMIWNDGLTPLYLALGAGASTASFTARVDGKAFYELPFPCYTGAISAVRAAGPASSVLVTELT